MKVIQASAVLKFEEYKDEKYEYLGNLKIGYKVWMLWWGSLILEGDVGFIIVNDDYYE